jgi:peptide/nickel transport system substrate-binding protein
MAAACGLLGSCSAHGGHAAGPSNVLVVAQSLDDLISLDPAEGFELSSLQTFTNIYQRLVQPDPDDPTMLVPTLAASWLSAKHAATAISRCSMGETFSIVSAAPRAPDRHSGIAAPTGPLRRR